MSRKMRMLLSGLALVAVVAMAWFFVISPLRADTATVNQSIADETTKLQAAQAKLASAEKTRAQGMANQAVLLELAKMVPQDSQVPSLLVQIQNLADQSGVVFLSLTPGAPIDSDDFQIIPLQLEFAGSYFDLSDFAYRVEQFVAGPGRLLTVKSVQLQIGSTDAAATTGTSTLKALGSSPSLSVSMTLYAFDMAPSGPSPAAGSATAGATTGTTAAK